MVRKCAVESCVSTDNTILSHRFPRNPKKAEIWKKTLKIKNISVKDLIVKYIVCTLHFDRSDYRNEISSHLNSTALPKLSHTSGFVGIKDEDMVIDPDEEISTSINLFEETPEDFNELIICCPNKIQKLEELDRSINDDKPTLEIPQKKCYSNVTKEPINSDLTAATIEDEETISELSPSLSKNICPESVAEDKHLEKKQTENNDSHSIIGYLELNNSKDSPIQIIYPSEEEDVSDEGEYANMPRKNLIKKLFESDEKIKELENKLETIQKAQGEMVKSIETFKKVLNCGF